MNEKELIVNILEDAEIGEINVSALKELMKIRKADFKYEDISDDLDWAMRNQVLEGYIWDRILVDKLGVNQDYDYFFTEEEDMVTDAKEDYDYSEEDFEPITEEELEKKESDDRISKYFEITKQDDDDFAKEAIMHSLPPEDIFEEFFEYYAWDTKVKYGDITFYIVKNLFNASGIIKCGYKSWEVKDGKEGYEVVKSLEEEIKKADEEERQAEIECDKLYDKIKDEISKVDKNSDLKYIARIYADIDFYSDIHKDVYGYRPRTEIGELNGLLRNANENLVEAFNKLPLDEQFKLMTN